MVDKLYAPLADLAKNKKRGLDVPASQQFSSRYSQLPA